MHMPLLGLKMPKLIIVFVVITVSFLGFTFGKPEENQECKVMDEKNRIVDYEDVKQATKNNSIYIIDVREPHELKETGEIPNSLNIPLRVVVNVLNNTKPEAFEKEYNRTKPGYCAHLIFTCRSGKRATDAANMVEKVGFLNTKIYMGSWLDWASHLNKDKS